MNLINELNNERVASPCIDQCCLNEQDICLGCYRHLDEITGWSSCNNEDKKRIIACCQQRKQSQKR
jgi:predicted Fe-S protein YdhL (DUF1289 family)